MSPGGRWAGPRATAQEYPMAQVTRESSLAAATSTGDRSGDPDADLRTALHALARGALLGARGNSGVILSQLLGALMGRMAKAGPDDRSAMVFATGLQEATDASYAAVGVPVEGSILSVARAASEAA